MPTMDVGGGLVEDLAALPTLDEKALLEEIRVRYDGGCIYTYIGDILIAVNPYKNINLYGHEFGTRYADVKVRSQLPPHIYAISDKCYQNLRRTGRNQCCVVSGESGAGKTESTKLMVQHIAQLCKTQNQTNLHERIVQVNPLLEAFGNAQTLMNNNSSRFGKFIELKFDQAGEIKGAVISEYLLEKSRIVGQGKGERNFHIFYYIFAGLDENQLRCNQLERPDYHRIMRPADGSPVFTSQSEKEYNAEMWRKLRSIMNTVGFKQEEVDGILAILASILHITDIVFEADPETEGVYIKDESLLEMAADMLCVPPEELVAALISNVTHMRGGERIMTLKTVAQANDGRDALAKALYGRLFAWIVRQVNIMLQPDRRRVQDLSAPTIGILDIAGFENFGTNSFEQLTINTANEQLQYYFNQHIFQWEMDEYKREGVKGKDVKFVDNRPLVDLFLEKPLGLYSLLDEESKFPQGTDNSFLEKITKQYGKKSHFKRKKGEQGTFIIIHYAGDVTYTVLDFLAKNRDTLSWNMVDCMKNSDSSFVADMFSSPISDTGSMQHNNNAPQRSRKSVIYCKAPELSLTRGKSLSKKAGKDLKNVAKRNVPSSIDSVRTLGSHFRNSLEDLMRKLLEGEPHFVRCIKPNHMKQANVFQADLVLVQLKYTGVLETVKIRRQGYATRLPHETFVESYKCLCFPMSADVQPTSSNCSKILKKSGIKDYEIGKTKVFLKYWHAEQLNVLMDKTRWQIVTCQRVIRGFIGRRKALHLLKRSRQDAEITRKFLDNINKSGEGYYSMMVNQQNQDSSRFIKEAEERKREEQELVQRIANPGAMLRPDSGAVNRQSRNMQSRMGVPTPMLLGNHVYGDGSIMTGAGRALSPTRDSTDTLVTEKPRGGLRRTPYEPPPNGNTPPPPPKAPPPERESSQSPNRYNLYSELLRESIVKYPDLNGDIWSKLFYMEKNQLVAKVYLRDWEVIVDNSSQEYDGIVIGLNAFDNPGRDKTSADILKKVGKGVKIVRDKEGNIYASQIGDCQIIVKGYKDPGSWCISEEVQASQGRLKKQPLKIFDMSMYKKQVADQLRNSYDIDQNKLELMSMVSFCFERNTFQDLETPCWVTMINFPALDILGNEKQFDEVKGLANLNLGSAEQTQLLRHWLAMNKRRDRRLSFEDPATPRTPNSPASWASNSTTNNNFIRPVSGYADSLAPPILRNKDRLSQDPPAKKSWAKHNSGLRN